jgi:uncharacterized protein (DUF488 family)
MEGVLYSIGHSNQTVEEFVDLLKRHGVNCVVDVRSVPASKYSPQFNQRELSDYLYSQGIQYLHFGMEFGARRNDCVGDDGQVNFEKAVGTEAFQKGVLRVMRGMAKGYKIAFMCSESEPLECHRFALVSRYFYDQGVDVKHIMKDGDLKTHKELEKEMIEGYMKSRKYHLSEVDEMFGSYTAEEQRVDAYRLKNKEIGYIVDLEEVEEI